MRRTLASIALAATAALVLGACADASKTGAAAGDGASGGASVSSSAAPSADAPASVTTASFVTDVAKAFATAGSYAFTFSLTASGTTMDGTGRVTGTEPGKLAMAISTDVGSAGTVSMLMVDGRVYLDGSIGGAEGGAEGKWIDLTDAGNAQFSALAQQMSSSADPTAMLAKLPDGALQLARGDASTIDGVPVTAYTMTLDVAQVGQATGQTITAEQLAALGSDGSMQIVYYLDASNRPLKVSITMGTVMSEEMTYTGFGTQEPVTAPAADLLVPASDLGL